MGNNKIIFNICRDSEFFGRVNEIERIYCYGASAAKSSYGVYLTGKKWLGKTELLKRVYHRLFWEQNKVVPIYYRFKDIFCNIKDFADDFLKDFIRQYIAFLKRDPAMVTEGISVNKLEQLLTDMELPVLSRFLALHREGMNYGDCAAVFKNAINTPHQTVALCNTPVFLILDDFNLTANIHLHEGGPGILKEYMKTLMSGSVSYLITGYTKGLFAGELFPGSIRMMELAGLEEDASVGLMAGMAERYNVACDSEILALAARHLVGNPVYLKSIIEAAKRKERGLLTIKDFVDLYVEELTEGNIGFSLGGALSIKSLNALRILHACVQSKNGTSEEELVEKTALGGGEIRGVISRLCGLGLLDIRCGLIEWVEDKVAEDYIRYLYETKVRKTPIAEAKTKVIREELKKTFYLEGVRISEEIKDELPALLKMFNGQAVPKILFRNQDFLAQYSGNTYTREDYTKEGEKVILPQIVGCSDSMKYGCAGKGLTIIVGYGFNSSGCYNDENEVAWIVGVKDTRSAIHLGDVENFTGQCGAIIGDIKIAAVARWIICKEGFTGEALKRLSIEGIHTTDTVQLRVLRSLVEDNGGATRPHNIKGLASLKEYEIILPMSTRAELVAAKAVEEIGINMGFDNNAVTQIKTALVEACINAFEHSRVKDRRVYCRVIAGDDRIVINVTNQGKDFAPAFKHETSDVVKLVEPSRRGWGIELMKQMMDEVRFERVHGGTKLVMTKYLKRNVEDVYERKS